MKILKLSLALCFGILTAANTFAQCTDNEDCTTAQTIPLNGPGNGPACVTDCNVLASPGLDFVGNGCEDQLNATVWYSFTTSGATAQIDINLTSTDLSDPEFTVFVGTTCISPWTILNCTEGSGFSATATGVSVATATTYLIAVSDQTGDEGNFQLCIEEFPDNSSCNTTDSLYVVNTSMGSPFTGPFQPGEVVEFCYSVTDFTQFNCNYLGAFIPEFGDCWDPVSFDGQGQPVNVTVPLVAAGVYDFTGPPQPCEGQPTGAWGWEPPGAATYNNIGGGYYPANSPLPGGWFFLTFYEVGGSPCSGPAETDPDNSYGDSDYPSCGNNTLDWLVCFQLQAQGIIACSTGETDCTVSMKTLADGEYGAWTSIGCVADVPAVFPAALQCCPLFDPMPDTTVCDSYTFPPITGILLTGNEAYYTGPGGTGTQYNPGNTVNFADFPTYPTTIYMYDDLTCTVQDSFLLVIEQTPIIDPVANLTACDSVQLPPITGTLLTGNEAYYDGPGGTGTQYAAGDWIFTSGTYYAYDETTSGTCFDEESFTITINLTPVPDAPADVTACDSYTLPGLGVGGYYSSPGGVGPIPVGTNITSTQTIYVYAETGTVPNCWAENSFTVTINVTPVADAPADVTACDSYTLPALGVGDYYSSPGGVGPIPVGTNITSTQTIYVYAETGTVPNCFDENSFVVTINPTPVADAPADVTACDSYTLPALGVGNYFSSPGGVGPIAVGTNITSTQTIYVYAETGTVPNCTDENSFIVTINTTPVADAPADVTACDSYTLPALGVGDYYSSPGGVGPIPVGTNITSTQTIYVYAETGTVPNCFDENSFIVTINPTPVADAPADVTVCDSYTLPALGVGNYYTATGGGGIMLNAGDVISSTQTIYVYAETGTVPNCTDENSFLVTINPTPTAADLNPSVCEDPPAGSGQAAGIDLTANNPNINGGGGLTFTWYTDPLATTPVGSPTNETVTNGETFYVVVSNGLCTDTAMVTYTVTATITLNNPAPQMCENPVGSGSYSGFDLTTLNPGVYVGSGSETFTWYVDAGLTTPVATPNNVTVTSATTYYVEVTDGNCSNSIMVTFTVNAYPVADAPADVTACDSYTLPALTVGNYFTATGGGGVMVPAGTNITSSQTLYVYAETGTTPNCTDENSFTITINVTPVADAPADVTACDSYTLPALTVGDYYTATGGGGVMLPAGTNITSSQTLYVYAETGTVPNCFDENSFTVTINTTPVADAPVDVTACDSFILPALSVGNYYTATGGGGTMMNAGDVITSTQTIYVYAETGTVPNCFDENSFVVTINPTPTATASTTTPNLCEGNDILLEGNTVAGGTYSWTGPNGFNSTQEDPTIVGATTAASGTYTLTITLNGCTSAPSTVTISVIQAPVLDPVADTSVCDSYTLPVITGTNLTGNENYYNNSQAGGGTVLTGPLTTTQTVWIYDGNGVCDSELSYVVTITPTDDPSFTITNFCEGDANAASVTGTPGGTFAFNPAPGDGATIDANTGEITNGVGGTTYTVEYTTSGVCPASSTQTVTVNALPVAVATTSTPDICEGEEIMLEGNTVAGGSYDWSGPNGFMSNAEDPTIPEAPSEATGTYTLIITANGCVSNPSTVNIVVIPCEIIVPTAITPGVVPNEVWEIINLDERYPNNTVIIYNRWGNEIYQHDSDPANPYNLNPWDGTNQANGEPLPVASYYYIIQFNDGSGEGLNGTVTIIKN